MDERRQLRVGGQLLAGHCLARPVELSAEKVRAIRPAVDSRLSQVAGAQPAVPKTSAAKRVVGETVNVVQHVPTVVNNPTGNGVVAGIDFEIQPYVAPVVR